MSLYTKIIDRQKLEAAWKRVKKNKPAAGVDEVTCEEFDAGLKENLAGLNAELAGHSYESLPVKNVVIYKGEKAREISLFSMRDKVVQQSVATELIKIYDKNMSGSVYAYRPGRAALQAVGQIETQLQKPEHAWMLKTDIKSFFDTVNLGKLYKKLSCSIREQDVLELIRACCEAAQLKKDGSLEPKRVGLYQGSGIAPVLSNIYMMDFDREMESRCRVYVRYSDDILILGESREALAEIYDFMRLRLEQMGLTLNESKTMTVPATEGADYLGYHLSSEGKMIPGKAEKNLQGRLEDIWIGDLPVEEKLKKGSEILNGWEQYYRKEREIGSIEEFAVVIYMVRKKDPDVLKYFCAQRSRFHNIYRDICRFLASVWQDDAACLMEYEQFYEMDTLDDDVSIREKKACCELFQRLIEQESEELWSELMQLYSDSGAYNKAAKTAEHRDRFAKSDAANYAMVRSNRTEPMDPEDHRVFEQAADSSEFLMTFLETFAGRDDIYGREELNDRQKRCVMQVNAPLTEDVVSEHLRGQATISTYLQRTNATVKFMVIDIDVSKKNLLQDNTDEVLDQYLPKAAETAGDLLTILKRLGLKGYLEYSGFRGYHIWVFFTEWIPTRYVNMLTDLIETKRENKSADITVEYFPNKRKLKNGYPGQSIKLPCGIHLLTGNRSMMLSGDFRERVPDREEFLDLARYSAQAVKRIIGAHTKEQQQSPLKTGKTVDENLEAFGELPDSIKVVLAGCNLMRYLCQKARTTGYLTHFERLSVLYVFGHIGDDGKAFVHTVMELTLNYKYHVTEKFIQKIPEKPVSCAKLRDQYKQITAEFGCSCVFRRSKNCYPSPVIHAIESGEDVDEKVTIPTSRTMSREKEKQVVEELNVHKKVQELAAKIVELKKQKRGIDKNIHKIETELEKIFDQTGSDCMEIDMGLLVRRKKDRGYEWVIEI